MNSQPVSSQELFGNVEDYLGLFGANGQPKADRIAQLLSYGRKDVSAATDMPVSKVRLEPKRIPKELVNRMIEWATALNMVGEFFRDEKKTILWFQTSNPMLGNISPRDMIRVGRFRKLFTFIQTALEENRPE